ncbi:DNA-binding response regulator [Clostridium perfringens]|nr:DNA-binding response regulator [Clostridium perfringens]
MSSIARKIATKKFEGYIQVVKIIDEKIIKLGNFKYSNLKEIKKYIGETDVYYTPNSNFNGKRGVENLKQLRALYLDFDIHNKSLNEKEMRSEINFIIAEVWLIADKGVIPRPTKAIVTGRGVHVYWDLEPSSYGALATWQELEDYLYQNLKHLGADKKATDASRLMRLINTINSKSKSECYMYVYEKENIYSMYDLREIFLNWSSRHKNVYKNKDKTSRENGKKINLFNSYTLHMARSRDLKKIVKLRNYNVTGYRNFILHCYAYWEGIYVRNFEDLKKIVCDLNNSFTEPLKNNEVDKILRCIPKAIDKFLEYEQGIRSGKIKRVTKGMRDKGGYWYKNETIIERLNITLKEQEYLETIIGINEKYNRNNKRRTPRNENGLTKKQQELKDEEYLVKELRKQGLSMQKIAKKMNISKAKVVKLANI